jgi:hypothetical protein
MEIRMQTLKNLCDNKDFHRVLDVIHITIRELQTIYCPDFNEKKCTALLNMIRFFVSKCMWSEAISHIGKIKTEMNMIELIMTRRLHCSGSEIGNLNALPMDAREYIATLI